MPGMSGGARSLPAMRLGIDLARRCLAVVVRLLAQQLADELRAHAAAEVLAEAVRGAEAALQLTEERLVGDDLLRPELVLLDRLLGEARQRPLLALGGRIVARLVLVGEELPDVAQAHPGVLVVRLGVVDVRVERLLDVRDQLLALLLGELLDVDLEALGPEVILVLEAGLIGALEVGDAGVERLLQLVDALLLLAGVAVELRLHLRLELGQVAPASLLVHPGDDRCCEVEDLLELLGSHVEQVPDAARDALEEPDVADRSGEVDVAHALTAHLGPRHLDAAALADDALVADALVLAAVALPVLGRTEDALAEEAVLLRLERAVVDRLGLGDLA